MVHILGWQPSWILQYGGKSRISDPCYCQFGTRFKITVVKNHRKIFLIVIICLVIENVLLFFVVAVLNCRLWRTYSELALAHDKNISVQS